jgi:methylmalonyl-CoA mutase cobalamin-binding subunit
VVEVLNGTQTPGLARVGARALRKAGFDVVYLATAPAAESTMVLVRRGEVDPGTRVRKALGLGTVKSVRDSTRHVDVTVILGPDFKGPDEVHP